MDVRAPDLTGRRAERSDLSGENAGTAEHRGVTDAVEGTD